MHGYTLKTVEINGSADAAHLGVRLGRYAIEKNIPVKTVAKALGVSRQTIYKWFKGEEAVSVKHSAKVEAYITQ